MKTFIPTVRLLALMAFTGSLVAGEPFSIGSPQETKPPASDKEKLPAVESGYIQVDGGKIFYEAAGQGPVIITGGSQSQRSLAAGGGPRCV